jgi:hypothetical protein
MGNAELQGYDEFVRATDKIERALPNAMAESSAEFARQWVEFAQARAYDDYSQEAAAALIVSTDGEGATITNSSVVFYGSEFGGQARPETMQFPPWMGQRGYWFYPARRDNAETLNEIWGKGIDVAMSPWNRRG